ncbi:MAG: phosphate ABC transporter permease PstA [Thermoleophilaceae bacterium]|nr:phosphate ABC transporter permease PstA [Thermoleophilaceae bacterium]
MSATVDAPRVAVQVIPPADSRAKLRERAFEAALIFALLISLAMLIALFIDVFTKGLPGLSPEFVTDKASAFPANAGIATSLLGTLWLMVVCIVFIVPIGLASAVYLEEYGTDYADQRTWTGRMIGRFNTFVEVNIQNLAAVPSIVYGILGLAFLVRGPLDLGKIILAGGLTLGLLVLPVVIIAGREALRAVPSSIREGSMALGATKWQTIWRQVLPAAVPGVATGVILALSRAIGETAPLLLLGAATFNTQNPSGIFSAISALPLQINTWISAPGADFQALAASAIIVLLVVLVLMNSVAIYLRNRYEQKW